MQTNSSGYRSGSSHKARWVVAALVIILMLAINATWAWLYHSKRTDFHNQLNDAKQTAANQKNKNAQLTTELTASKQKLAQKTNQKAQSQPVTSDYRDIPELGVKYKLTDQTKNLTYTYKVDSSKSGNTVDRVGFSTVALTESGAKEENLSANNFQNPCTSGSMPAGLLSRYSPGQIVESQNKPIDQVSDAIKVGNYYFLYTTPQAACGQSQDNSMQQQAIAAAKEAANSLQLISQ